MPIIPDTLKNIRKSKNLSQQKLADASRDRRHAVSKRTIARIESGDTPPETVRPHTLKCIADTLQVDPGVLCKPSDESFEQEASERGYVQIKELLPPDVAEDYRIANLVYGVNFYELILAAPWMFTLLAQQSLSERKVQIDEIEASFNGVMDQVPSHLNHGKSAYTDIEGIVWDERTSLAARDIFGKRIFEEASARGGDSGLSDRNETNPFIAFLRRAAADLDHDVLDPDELNPNDEGLPRSWPIFRGWLHEIAGRDPLALFAIKRDIGIVHKIPKNLRGDDNVSERIQWLIDQVPTEELEREKERMEKIDETVRAMLASMEEKL